MTTDNEQLPVDVELNQDTTAIEYQIAHMTKEQHQKALEELGLRTPDRSR